jgi:cytosine/adenosine deaminase-related metal-dependent hydrolase
MQVFALRNPGVTPEQIVKLATMNGARALRLPEDRADLIGIEYLGSASELAEFLVNQTPCVRRSWIDGASVAI